MLQVLPGNTNTYTVVEQTLEPPILATRLRILPQSVHVRTVCMRLEIVGCYWTGNYYFYNLKPYKQLLYTLVIFLFILHFESLLLF